MLYKKNSLPFSEELFKNPTSEYRAAPFWAWNCRLRRDLLEKEIDCMKDMGFGGFHIHCRVGMSTKYLSDDFMSLVKSSLEKGKKNEMLTWLYDEDKWPSGFAGGYVTKDPEYREKYLSFGKNPPEDSVKLASYNVTLDENGCLESYERDENGEYSACLCVDKPSYWHNRQTYVDTLSKPAIDEFIRVTHERYAQCCGEDFGETIPAIFTDEPQFSEKKAFDSPFTEAQAVIPFTTDFTETYKQTYGDDLFDKIPEVFWDLPDDKISLTRYRVHDHIAERFARAFADNIGSWCEEHGIALTGHMMNEPSLESQNKSIGDCMRSYRGFGIPGIDMLCDSRETTTAKQTQSAVHQYGREGMLSELYGVTGWDFDFRGHILQGDWQAALGVSVRVPHLYWVSMNGEAKRDYPACIGHQSPWYKEYKYVEDHFARVNACMVRGKPVVKIGVIHPIESYWVKFGPRQQSAETLRSLDDEFYRLNRLLLTNLLDFDYICEGNLPSQANGTKVGEMQYDTILVPRLYTIRSTTLDFLRAFTEGCGRVIFIGGAPDAVDAVKSDEAKKFAEDCLKVSFSAAEINSALAGDRMIDLRSPGGNRTSNHIYSLRADGDSLRLFICPLEKPNDDYRCRRTDYTLSVKGEYAPLYMDTFTGEIKKIGAEYRGGQTYVTLPLYCQDSVLLQLDPGRSDAEKLKREDFEPVGFLPAEAEVSLEEDNVLLLDMPEYSYDGGAWHEKTEILRLCDRVKDELRLDNAVSHKCQPWVLEEEAAEDHEITLRYTFRSLIDCPDVSLALEGRASSRINFNGAEVENVKTGCYVDDSIETLRLGNIVKGENVLEITRPFGAVTAFESVFVLGDFGVCVKGTDAVVTEPVRELAFGDYSRQGLAFYGGNLTYKTKITCGGETAIRIPHFAQPVVKVRVDGIDKGLAAVSPFTVSLGDLDFGEHTLELTAYGNRINTFGALHMYDDANKWYGPNAWGTEWEEWSDEYRLKECGITSSPMIMKVK